MIIEARTGEKDNFGVTSTDLLFPNNVYVHAIGVHHVRITEDDSKLIGSMIKDVNFAMVEADSTLLSNMDIPEVSGYNDTIMTRAWKQRKKVVCCDPLAETNNLAVLDFLISGTSFLATPVLAISAMKDMISKTISRRTFLKMFGIGVAGTLTGNTSFGESAQSLITGNNGTSKHPVITDPISYAEYRNSAVILGLDQLINRNIIKNNERGVFIAGVTHLDDYRGYQTDGYINIDKAADVYRNNIYTRTANLIDFQPTARVWIPLDQERTFDLQHRIDINT